jgi:hypothetical protein
MASDVPPEADSSGGARLERVIRASPVLEPIIRRWAEVSLPDCWLVAGAIVQTVWNDAFGFDPRHGVKDADLVYFDAADLSEDTEAGHAARIETLFGDLGVHIDVKNEAACISGMPGTSALKSRHIPRHIMRSRHSPRPRRRSECILPPMDC